MLNLRLKIGDSVCLDYPGQPRVWLTFAADPSHGPPKFLLLVDAAREVKVWRESIAPPEPAEGKTP